MFSGKSLLSLVVVTLAALVVPLLGVTSASAAPERRLAKKTADLSRVAGFPTSTEPGRRIARATMVIHYHENGTADLDVDVTLVDSAGGGQLQYGVGTTNGSGECNLTHGDTRSTWSGATEYSDWVSLPVNRVFNCASVQVVHGSPTDQWGGRLRATYVQPKLTVSRPQLLGKSQKQLKLVRKAKQNHEFEVRNTGKYRARNVVLVAKGKGMKTVRKRVGTIAPGKSATVKVPLTLKTKKKTKVKFTVSGSGVKAARTVKVKAVKAPAKPAAGKWRSTNKSFTFTVKNRKITKFRGIMLRMTCGGGYHGYQTYRTVNLTFPTVKVPKHGYFEAQKKWRKGDAWYNASLSGRVVGKKMTQAKFTYFTAGNCSVVDRFTARRR